MLNQKGMKLEKTPWVYFNLSRNKKLKDKFVIFGQGRSGTHLLRTLLNCHSEIYCAKEILRRSVYLPYYFIYQHAMLSNVPIFGFALKIYNITTAQRMKNPRQFLSRLARGGWKFIYLKRDNILRQSVSKLRALAVGKHSYYRKEDLVQKSVTIREDDLWKQIRKRKQWSSLEELVLADLPVHRMIYEKDLLRSSCHQESANGIFDFLDLPRVPVTSVTLRISSDHLREQIANYDELVGWIRNTELEKYLYDPDYDPSRMTLMKEDLHDTRHKT